MKAHRSILAGSLLMILGCAVQAAPLLLTESIRGTNITSSGTSFTHSLDPGAGPDGAFDQALLSLSLHVSRNAAAQHDLVSLYIGGVLQVSGLAADFSFTNLDVSDYFDFTTGTLTFDLFREVHRGGGVIKLKTSTLSVAASTPGGQAGNDSARLPAGAALGETFGSVFQAQPFQAQPFQVLRISEPGTLALLGFGLFAMTAMRRRAERPDAGKRFVNALKTRRSLGVSS